MCYVLVLAAWQPEKCHGRPCCQTYSQKHLSSRESSTPSCVKLKPELLAWSSVYATAALNKNGNNQDFTPHTTYRCSIENCTNECTESICLQLHVASHEVEECLVFLAECTCRTLLLFSEE